MTNEERKSTKIFQGVLMYFPNAVREVAKCSLSSNQQHNGDAPLFWDMNKSKDELGSLTRHLVDLASGEEYDEDGTLNLAKIAWRALGALERHLTGGEAFEDETFYKELKQTANEGRKDNNVRVSPQDGQTIPHQSTYSVTTHTGRKLGGYSNSSTGWRQGQEN